MMCYYLNVQFNGQMVKYEDNVPFISYRFIAADRRAQMSSNYPCNLLHHSNP